MQHLEVSGAERHIYASLGFKGLICMIYRVKYNLINKPFREFCVCSQCITGVKFKCKIQAPKG